MSRIVVALSGPIASGKTTLATGLAEAYGAAVLSTRTLLQTRFETERGAALNDRQGLQEFGQVLDEATDGTWLADDVQPELERQGEHGILVIDAARIKGQLDALRQRYGRKVWHVHVRSSNREELARRYSEKARRGAPIREFDSYDEALENRTEAGVPDLERLADVVLDTHRNTPADVVVRCAARLGLLPDLGEPLVDALVGGEYGSEGKGNVAFYLAPEYDVLMRVGGPNAGHKVPTDTPYTHRSLPSGTLANPTARLLIGPGAVLNVDHLLKEIRETGVTADRLVIDPQAMVITSEDVSAEEELKAQIGSTGQGVGRAAARRILSRGTSEVSILAKGDDRLAPYLGSTGEALDGVFAQGKHVFLEGTQGTGLSLFHGVYPYVTSRDTTVSGVLSEAGISPRRLRRTVMVCRTYPIRVGGNSGPMGQAKDLSWQEIALRSGVSRDDIDERGSVSGNERRVAEFDWPLLRRSAELNGVTDVAITFADYIDVENRNAFRYDQLTAETIQFIEEVEQVSGAPVSLIATNFSRRSVIDRREWRGRPVN